MAKSNRVFYPGNRYLILYLTFLSAFAPISTDLYLPSLPAMAADLNISNDDATATISLFFVAFALSMLFWGPIADRYGRKPALVAGSIVYSIASVFIAFAGSLETALFWRCAQAVGAGAASALSLTIVKDLLKGRLLANVVSFMQMAGVLAPLVAPTVGGFLTLFTNWRGIFLILALCGVLSLLGACCLKETARVRSSGGLLSAFARIKTAFCVARFRAPLLIFSAMIMPFMSYLALSAFVYQEKFGVSPRVFGLFFALNSCVILLGPASYLKYFHKFNRGRLIFWQMALMSVAGCFFLLFGSLNVWTFALLFAPISFCGSLLRPPTTLIMLESVRGDNAVVASLINCCALLFASLSMFIAALPFWPSPILAIGATTVCVSGACAIAWRKILSQYDKEEQ